MAGSTPASRSRLSLKLQTIHLMVTSKKQFKTVDEYIGIFPKDVQEILEKIRQTIKEAAPQAEEVISYQMPAFKLKGRILVYYSGWKNHIGLYPPAPESFKKETAQYEGHKGNLKFPIDKPIPYDLIQRIVEYKSKES